MDNPWADPWDETSKKTTTQHDKPLQPKWGSLPTLELPKPDVEPPSWEPQDTVPWAAPTDNTPLPSWGVEEPSWTPPDPPNLDEIVISAPEAVSNDEPQSEPEDQDEEGTDSVSLPATPVVPPRDPLPPVAPPPPPPPPLEVTPISFSAASPSLKTPRDLDDGFGGFESGLDSATDEDGGWGASPDPYLESEPVGGEVWGSSWGEQSSSDREEQPDEWEAARKQKEEQDKHVVSSHYSS